MKRLLIICLITFLAACATNKTKFTPNMSLLTTWEKSERTSEEHNQPYIAIFKKDGKTLIYLASEHDSGKTLDMVDYIYTNFKPQIAVVEFERSGRLLKNTCSWNEFEYSTEIASHKNIPVVLADLTFEDKLKILSHKDPGTYQTVQARWMISNAMSDNRPTTAEKEVYNFEYFMWKPWMPKPMGAAEFKEWFMQIFKEDFDKADLRRTLGKEWRYPLSTGTVLNKLSEDEDILARDPFMIKNITAALNKYDTVYAAFGEGHYRSHRKVLEDMLGKPEYIWDIEYTDRKNCKGFQIKEEVLVTAP